MLFHLHTIWRYALSYRVQGSDAGREITAGREAQLTSGISPRKTTAGDRRDHVRKVEAHDPVLEPVDDRLFLPYHLRKIGPSRESFTGGSA
jgi:hypothetical protein